MEKMTETIQLALILCVTNVIVTLINKWHTYPKRPEGTQQKEGAKR
jgi:hypothetical protein